MKHSKKMLFGIFLAEKLYYRELKLNHMINKRHEGYEKVLQKELTLAKNIIKNPVMLKKAERDANFHRVDIYTIKNTDAELKSIGKSPKKKNKMFESFNFNNDEFNRSM